MMEMGQRNLIVFIVLPTFFLLEIYAAVLRSNCLFHIYKDKSQPKRRSFRTYNFQKKSLLYKLGKRKGFDYSQPKVKERGYFFNKYGIDEEAYRKKKSDSLGDFDGVDGSGNTKEDNLRETIKKLLLAFIESNKMPYLQAEKALKKWGLEFNNRRIGEHCREIKEKLPPPLT